MKVVCLIKPLAPTIYFVNHIHQYHSVSLVIIESEQNHSRSALGRIIDSIQTDGLLTTIHTLAVKCNRSNLATMHQTFFGDHWKRIHPDIPSIEVADINSRECQERLSAEQPDLLLDHGTSIVKPHILETAPLALNLHWGLSPYYRGTQCTKWALINWDPYNIGVTIHKLSKRIDGGDILAQHRATVSKEDNADSINMQLTKLGTDMIVDIVERLKNGASFHYSIQDLSKGLLNLNRQWSRHWENHVRFIEENGVIAKMLKSPARQALPIEGLRESVVELY
jgi:folate-dependent phosphoribosylglycinamide formyltransferase PurN